MMSRRKASAMASSRREKLKALTRKGSLQSAAKRISYLAKSTSLSKKLKLNESNAATRRRKKIEKRRKDRRTYTAQDWAAPVPANLNAKLEVPKVKTKYQSYFEFTENPEKKKKLEFQVTNKVEPPPGYAFVPIGDPAFTNACKELSREKDAMIFIVSNCKEDHSKISEHIYRIGFHFRETIIEKAREFLGKRPGDGTNANDIIEPIPESQEEINKQADAAIRDLFPRIPNTDRRMVIEHAFQKGAMSQGEPTVGTQSNIPLSRRVQLAVLAHIRHNHTRYDKLLRETSWINARKAVEPVCLDIIVKWRGDEETGRDQMDEILREVVIISDSESDDDEEVESESDSSHEEDEVILCNSPMDNSLENSDNHPKEMEPHFSTSSRTNSDEARQQMRDKRARRGFKRYQAAWEDALHRQQDPSGYQEPKNLHEAPLIRNFNSGNPYSSAEAYPFIHETTVFHAPEPKYHHSVDNPKWHRKDFLTPLDARSIPIARSSGKFSHNNEVIMIPTRMERVLYYHNAPQQYTGTYMHQHIDIPPSQGVAKYGPQDMLVESIETPSQGALASCPEERFVSDTINRTQGSNLPRLSAKMHQTPARRQVIIIDDDSPEVKRRRMTYEDDFSHPRLFSSRNHDVIPTYQKFDHPRNSVSTVQPRDFPVRPLRSFSQNAYDVSRNTCSVIKDTVVAGEAPVYEAQQARYLSPLPKFPDRAGAGLRSGARLEPIDLTLPESTPKYDNFIGRLGDEQYRRQRSGFAERAEHTNQVNEYHGNWASQSIPYHTYRTNDVSSSIPWSNHRVNHAPPYFPADSLVLRTREYPTVISNRDLTQNPSQLHCANHHNTFGSYAPSRMIRARSPRGITEGPMCSSESIHGSSRHTQSLNRYKEGSSALYNRRNQFPRCL